MRKIESIQTVFIFFLSLVCLLFVMHKSFAQTQSGSIGVVVEDSTGANKMSVNNNGSINVSGTITSDTAGLAKDTSLQTIISQLANPLTVTATVGNFPATQAISAASLPLPSLASTAAKQDTGNTSLSSIDTKLSAATGGSISNSTSITSTATTFSPPANALGFVFEAESSNTDNVRWAVGGTASTSVGNLYEPGRDSVFIPVNASISAAAVSGTQTVSVQWITK